MDEPESERILRLAAASELPRKIDGSTTQISVAKFRELYDADLVDAIDASSPQGPTYLNPTITERGRAYLRNNPTTGARTVTTARFVVILIVLAVALGVWLLMDSNLGGG